MTQPKHTPGPWAAEIQPVFGHIYIRQDPKNWKGMGYKWIADCRDSNDAHLIAAAPDMYEALAQIVFDWDGEPEDMADARAAIAKAEGREI